MFIPLKDLNPRRSYPLVNTTLILANIAVFLYQYTLPPHAFKVFMIANATIPARFPAWLGGHAPFQTAFLPLLTSMFLHSGVMHIAGNMLFLWIFGDNVEDFYGHFTYLFFYLVCGIGSGLMHVLFNMSSAVPALGASGAISGVMGAYLILYPRSQVLTLIFIFLVPVPAVIILGLWFILQFLSAFSSLGAVTSGGVAWWAHVGGFLLGMLITVMARGKRSARWQTA
ncbi:MAG TPA: rhomboid family intramembrane serine protease [Candidatus Acidoferrum sp.]|nr:rhomboid family intramembrane serine protease [Candidatus Acidoferrum sp.]